MKKIAVYVTVALLALCVLIVAVNKAGAVKSQTSQPATSTPTTSTPATSTPATSTPSTTTPATTAPSTSTFSYNNRPLGRWLTSNTIFLTTLINDTKKTVDNLISMDLSSAEQACPQLRCDIATMKGNPPPVDTLGWSRALRAAPSGYRCPPIPDALAAQDLNDGMALLESAINNIITGINAGHGDYSRGDLIQLGELQMKQVNDYFAKVLKDIAAAQK